MNEVKWGIIGSGRIANKFADSIKLVQNARLIACSSKDASKALDFKNIHELEFSYGNYEEMLLNPSIDAVYIATTHNFHYENALLCIKYNKHILCEKAFTVNAIQAREIFDKAKEKNLFVMEGMWTRFLPVTSWLKEQVKNGQIGEPLKVFAQFGVNFPYDPDSRAFNINLAGGGLLDLGIYAISFVCNILGTHPVEVSGDVVMGKTGVDEKASINLVYADKKAANINYSLMEDYENTASVYGTTGKVTVDNLSTPTKGILENTQGVLEFENKNSNGFEYEIQEATNLILKGETQSQVISANDTISMLEICDSLRKQWNFKYPEEK